MFRTHSLSEDDADLRLGLALSPFRTVLLRRGIELDALLLSGESLARLEDWIETRLDEAGLVGPGVVQLPYDLPEGVASCDTLPPTSGAELATLAGWFTLAETQLSAFVRNNRTVKPGPSPVRCWPHHFDIATYVSLEAGDAETAKGIGVGMSPGDDNYDQPYFYVNPWPHIPESAVGDSISPGHWHSKDFVGAIATGKQLLTLGDIAVGTAGFLGRAFVASRKALNA